MDNENKKNEKSLIDSELKDKIREDLEIDEFNLEEQCRKSMVTTQKYLELYYSRKRILSTLNMQLETLHADLYKKFKFGGMSIRATTASDANILVRNREEYITLKKKCERMEELVDFLEDTIKQFKDRNWMIKNILEIRKMDNT